MRGETEVPKSPEIHWHSVFGCRRALGGFVDFVSKIHLRDPRRGLSYRQHVVAQPRERPGYHLRKGMRLACCHRH